MEAEISDGYCRRRAPTVGRISGTLALFPIVEADSWCGEHEKKP